MAARKQQTAETEVDTRGDRTRRLIKRTIAKLAQTRDVADITLSDICAAAKITTGAVYFHFGGKDEAIEEMVIDEVTSSYQGYFGPTGEAADTFEEFVSVIVQGSTRYLKTRKRIPRAIVVVINTRPKAYQAWLEARRPVLVKLEDLIAKARAAQGLSTEPAPFLAHFILNSIEDLAIDVFDWKNPTLTPFAEQPEEWNARQIALWTHAVLAPFPPAAGPDLPSRAAGGRWSP